MIDVWLALPGWMLMSVLALFYAATGSAVWWVSFGRPLRGWAQGFKGVVAPFFGAVSVLFALQAGFLANDVVVRNREAVAAVNGEADTIREVFALSVASASDMTVIHRTLVEYLRAVLADEWPAMGEERVSERTAMALAELLHRVSDPAIARDAGQAVHTALLNSVMQIIALRSQRLALAADGSSTLKWGIVLLLGVVTQVALGLVHLDRSRPQLAAVAVFSAAAVVALGLIAMQEWPFSGVVQISAAPMHDALKVISAS
jgi:uncharacterized protein DUF4239